MPYTFSEIIRKNIIQWNEDGGFDDESQSVMEYINIIGGVEAAPVIDALMARGLYESEDKTFKIMFTDKALKRRRRPKRAIEPTGIIFCDGETYTVINP